MVHLDHRDAEISTALLCPMSESLCLASGLLIISQLDKVINDLTRPAGPGTDTHLYVCALQRVSQTV